MNAFRFPIPSAMLCLVLLSVLNTSEGQAAKVATAGKLLSESGSLAIRESLKPVLMPTAKGEGSKWKVPAKGADLPANQMCVALPNALIASPNGAVHLHMRANFDKHSPLPTVESAVVLHNNPKVDLDVTLDRGRIGFENKRKGKSKVRVRFKGTIWDITLLEKDTLVGMELCGRWPGGHVFHPKEKTRPAPPTLVFLLVLKGKAIRQGPVCTQALKAPPGPAVVQWDSSSGVDRKPIDLDEVPDWVGREDTDPMREKRIKQFHQLIQKKPIREVLKMFLDAKEPMARRAGAYASAALDELDLVGDALLEGKHPDLWEHAVLAVRHWISRDPGYLEAFYRGLIARGKVNKAEAGTVVQLLLGFSSEALRQPETYAILIEYLRHEKMGIRGLANWHLQRLVPAGRKISYDPAGPKEARERAYKAWKKLIPDGKLPPSFSTPRSTSN